MSLDPTRLEDAIDALLADLSDDYANTDRSLKATLIRSFAASIVTELEDNLEVGTGVGGDPVYTVLR